MSELDENVSIFGYYLFCIRLIFIFSTISKGYVNVCNVIETLMDLDPFPIPAITDYTMLLSDEVNHCHRWWNAYNKIRAVQMNSGCGFTIENCGSLGPAEVLSTYATLLGAVPYLYAEGDLLEGVIHSEDSVSEDSIDFSGSEFPDFCDPHLDGWNPFTDPSGCNYTIPHCGRMSARDVLDVHTTLYGVASDFFEVSDFYGDANVNYEL